MNPAATVVCPRPTDLQRFVRESVPPDQAASIESHIDICSTCRRHVVALLDDQRPRSLEKLLQQRARSIFPETEPPVPNRLLCVRAEDRQMPRTIGRYEVLQELGRGTYGVVYRAFDDALARQVAIKVPHDKVFQSIGGRALYLEEAKALAQLDHPHIVRVYEATAHESGCYIVSQFIGGCDLAEYLLERKLTPQQAVTLLLPLLDALQHAHERGICHRDVKPANILIDESGKPFLADFGLALREDRVGQGTGYVGTPAYMSPEQARGQGHRVDGRTDIYSIGVIFFKLLTGRRPFQASSVNELLELVIKVDAPSAKQKDRSIPRELDRICARALARRLSQRYQSASEMADDLNQWLSELGSTSSFTAIGKSWAGRRTIGEFHLKAKLGCGAMGVVYRARQSSADRDVALKCLRVDDPKARQRFSSEIRALGKVEHPNLVRIYTSGFDGDRYYYAMELIAGTSFDNLKSVLPNATTADVGDESWTQFVQLATQQKQSEEQPIDLVLATVPASEDQTAVSRTIAAKPAQTQACESIAYIHRTVRLMRDIVLAAAALHDHGIIHRDIKPANILLTADGQRAVLMDLGIAKWVDQEESGLTRTREFLGSLRYASPEQVIDAASVDHRSDIYSLGATLWEMLTLRPLYDIQPGLCDAKAMLRIELNEPAPARRYNRAVPSDLQAILQKCLEKNPDRRYESAAALAEDLDSFLQGSPVKARPVSRLRRAARRWRRCPLVPCFSILLGLMMIGLVAASLPDRRSETIRVGIKPWVGFSPLVVADELGLCDGVDLQFVPVSNTSEVRRRILAKELEAAPYLVDSHAIARAEYTPTQVVLQLDVSLQADAMVVTESVNSFQDLKGTMIAYMHHEAPHFLLLALCEMHDLDMNAFQHVKVETAKAAAELFVAGKVDAVVTYEPFVQLALSRPGAHRLGSAADDPGSIIDILTFREDVLQHDAGKVQRIIAGWMQAVDLLQQGDPRAIAIACRFLGQQDQPISPAAYHQMAAGMRYGSVRENLDFFRLDSSGTNEFQRRMQTAQQRWDRHHQLPRHTDPAEGDSSSLFMEMYSGTIVAIK